MDNSPSRRSDNQHSAPYNMKALVRCDATYLGAALPTKTTQPPGIIHEPLAEICAKENLHSLSSQSKKPVKLFVFHSGIIIEIMFGKHSGDLVWYPIKHLYCSAGVQPLRTKHGTIEFKSLEDNSKSPFKPIFSLVVRETVSKKVLQCYAFSVARKELAQLLVQATALAYKDRSGWDLPLNTDIFGGNDYKYTLNIADEIHLDSGYSDLEESSRDQSPQSSELSVLSDATKHDNPTTNNNKPSDRITVSPKSSDSKSPTVSKPSTPKLCIPALVTRSQSRPASSPSTASSSISMSSTSSKSSPSLSPRSAKPKRHSKPKAQSKKESNTYQGFQSDSLYPDEDGFESTDCGAPSLSSAGYPLSRESSTGHVTTYHKVAPNVVVIQKVNKTKPISGKSSRGHNADSDSTLSGSSSKCDRKEPVKSSSDADDRHSTQSDNDKTLKKESDSEGSTRPDEPGLLQSKRDRRHTDNSFPSPVTTESSYPQQQYLRSVSLDDYNRTKPRYVKTVTPPAPLVEIVDIDGVPHKIVHHHYNTISGRRTPTLPYLYPEPQVYMHHHPDQFMYEGSSHGYPSRVMSPVNNQHIHRAYSPHQHSSHHNSPKVSSQVTAHHLLSSIIMDFLMIFEYIF